MDKLFTSALSFLIEHTLPQDGIVLLHEGEPIGWEHDLPEASAFVPGVIAIDMVSRRCLIAHGGNASTGAESWKEPVMT